MACSASNQARLDELLDDLASVTAAIRKVEGGAQQYTLNTSQTQQTVTRGNLGQLYARQERLRQEIRDLEAECSGGRVIQVRPNW